MSVAGPLLSCAPWAVGKYTIVANQGWWRRFATIESLPSEIIRFATAETTQMKLPSAA
jgi:hypothetical protein